MASVIRLQQVSSHLNIARNIAKNLALLPSTHIIAFHRITTKLIKSVALMLPWREIAMSTPKEELTAKRLEKLMPADSGKRYEIADTHVRGFRVRVGDAAVESGSRRRKGKAAQISYILLGRFKPNANPTRRTLGRFPEMGLADARRKAIEWKALIRAGIDPAEEANRIRIEADIVRQNRRSLSEVLDQYERDKLDGLRRGKATRRALDGKCGLLGGFLNREPSSIMRSEIRTVLRTRAELSPISANRQLAYANAFFNWCVVEEIISENPARLIPRPALEIPRDRHHSLPELAEIWAAAGQLGYPFGPLIRLLIVLPMRREELAALATTELDLGDDDAIEGVWTLPSDRTKRANALRVPLSPLARLIIKGAIADEARPKKSQFVFTTTGKTSVSGFGKAKRRLDTIIQQARAKVASDAGEEPEPMAHWTFHDLRTTFTTLACEDLNVDAAVADRILNHVATATTSKIMRTYNKSELFGSRREALNAWGSLIQQHIIDPPSDKIVPIRAGRT